MAITEDNDNFTLLAEKICTRYFNGALPGDAEAIASKFLTLSLPTMREFLTADEEIAQAAFERISSSLVAALRAHHVTHQAGWEN
jgi:hypothetical protein